MVFAAVAFSCKYCCICVVRADNEGFAFFTLYFTQSVNLVFAAVAMSVAISFLIRRREFWYHFAAVACSVISVLQP